MRLSVGPERPRRRCRTGGAASTTCERPLVSRGCSCRAPAAPPRRLLVAGCLVLLLAALVSLPPGGEARSQRSRRAKQAADQQPARAGPNQLAGRESSNWWSLWWQQYIDEAARPTVRPVKSVALGGQRAVSWTNANLAAGAELPDLRDSGAWAGDPAQGGGAVVPEAPPLQSTAKAAAQGSEANQLVKSGAALDLERGRAGRLIAANQSRPAADKAQLNWRSIKPKMLQLQQLREMRLTSRQAIISDEATDGPRTHLAGPADFGIQMRAQLQRNQQPSGPRPAGGAGPAQSSAANELQPEAQPDDLSRFDEQLQQQQHQMVDYSDESELELGGQAQPMVGPSVDSSSSNMMVPERQPDHGRVPGEPQSATSKVPEQTTTTEASRPTSLAAGQSASVAAAGGAALPATTSSSPQPTTTAPARLEVDISETPISLDVGRSNATANGPTTTLVGLTDAEEMPPRSSAAKTTPSGRVQLVDGRPAGGGSRVKQPVGTTTSSRLPTPTASGQQQTAQPGTRIQMTATTSGAPGSSSQVAASSGGGNRLSTGPASITTTMRPLTTTTAPLIVSVQGDERRPAAVGGNETSSAGGASETDDGDDDDDDDDDADDADGSDDDNEPEREAGPSTTMASGAGGGDSATSNSMVPAEVEAGPSDGSDSSSPDGRDGDERGQSKVSGGLSNATSAPDGPSDTLRPLSMTTNGQQSSGSASSDSLGSSTIAPMTTTTPQPVALTTVEIERLPKQDANGPAGFRQQVPDTRGSTRIPSKQQQQQQQRGGEQDILMMTIDGSSQAGGILDGETAITVPMDAIMKMAMMNQINEQQPPMGASNTLTSTPAPSQTGAMFATTRAQLQQQPSGAQSAQATSSAPMQTTSSSRATPGSNQSLGSQTAKVASDAAATGVATTDPQPSQPQQPALMRKKLQPPPTTRIPGGQQVVSITTSSPSTTTTGQVQTTLTLVGDRPSSSSSATVSQTEPKQTSPDSRGTQAISFSSADDQTNAHPDDEQTFMAGGREPKIELINMDLVPIQRIMSGAASDQMQPMQPSKGSSVRLSEQDDSRVPPIQMVERQRQPQVKQTLQQQQIMPEVEPGMRLRPSPPSTTTTLNGQQQQQEQQQATQVTSGWTQTMPNGISVPNQGSNMVYMIMMSQQQPTNTGESPATIHQATGEPGRRPTSNIMQQATAGGRISPSGVMSSQGPGTKTIQRQQSVGRNATAKQQQQQQDVSDTQMPIQASRTTPSRVASVTSGRQQQLQLSTAIPTRMNQLQLQHQQNPMGSANQQQQQSTTASRRPTAMSEDSGPQFTGTMTTTTTTSTAANGRSTLPSQSQTSINTDNGISSGNGQQWPARSEGSVTNPGAGSSPLAATPSGATRSQSDGGSGRFTSIATIGQGDAPGGQGGGISPTGRQQQQQQASTGLSATTSDQQQSDGGPSTMTIATTTSGTTTRRPGASGSRTTLSATSGATNGPVGNASSSASAAPTSMAAINLSGDGGATSPVTPATSVGIGSQRVNATGATPSQQPGSQREAGPQPERLRQQHQQASGFPMVGEQTSRRPPNQTNQSGIKAPPRALGATKSSSGSNITSSFIPTKLRNEFNNANLANRLPATSRVQQQPETSSWDVISRLQQFQAQTNDGQDPSLRPQAGSAAMMASIRQFGGANRLHAMGQQAQQAQRPAGVFMAGPRVPDSKSVSQPTSNRQQQQQASRARNQPDRARGATNLVVEVPSYEYGPSIVVRRPDEPLANGQMPNCTLTGKNFCVLTKDYPMNEVRRAVERSFRSVRIMYEELQTVSDQELHKADFANATNSQAASGKFACQTQVEMMRPGWAKDEITKEWMLVVNTDVFPQRVRTESCAQPNTPCEFIAPFYDSTCQQRYSLHRMIAIDPHDPSRSPQVAVFRFPAGCVCRVHPIRKSSRQISQLLAAAEAANSAIATGIQNDTSMTTTTISPSTSISSSTSQSIRKRR